MQEHLGDMEKIAEPQPGDRHDNSVRADSGNADRRGTASAPAKDLPPLDKVDDASDDSFPASDAPAWTGMRIA